MGPKLGSGVQVLTGVNVGGALHGGYLGENG